MIFACYSSEILCAYHIPSGQTVNQECYRQFPMHSLRPALRKKRRSLQDATPLILHENATCHKSHRVTSLITSYHWDVLPYPPYSHDMSPSDFDLFPKLKVPLRGVCFYDQEDLEREVTKQVRRINLGCLATGIRDLPHRWESKRGGVISKECNQVCVIVL